MKPEVTRKSKPTSIWGKKWPLISCAVALNAPSAVRIIVEAERELMPRRTTRP